MRVPIDRIFTTVSRNLGLESFSRHLDSWVEWAFEAEQYIGSNDTFVEKEAAYVKDGAQATGTITFSAVPTSGDSITLNGTKLYFRSSTDLGEAKSPNELFINSTLDLTLTADAADYGLLESLSGYQDVANTTDRIINAAIFNYPEALNIADYSVDTDTDVLTITAKEIGSKGNDYTLDSDNANALISGLTLTGGKDLYRNQQVVLPDDMLKLLSVRIGDDNICYPSSSKFKSKIPSSNSYYLSGNRLNVNTDSVDSNSDAAITISYLSIPKDIRGWPTIKDGHETAVAQYIMWQHKLVEYYNGKLPQFIIKDLESRWYYLCSSVRGSDNMPNSIDLVRIGKLWNRLIPFSSWNPPLYDGLNSY